MLLIGPFSQTCQVSLTRSDSHTLQTHLTPKFALVLWSLTHFKALLKELIPLTIDSKHESIEALAATGYCKSVSHIDLFVFQLYCAPEGKLMFYVKK